MIAKNSKTSYDSIIYLPILSCIRSDIGYILSVLFFLLTHFTPDFRKIQLLYLYGFHTKKIYRHPLLYSEKAALRLLLRGV